METGGARFCTGARPGTVCETGYSVFEKGVRMRLGLRAILLIVAILLFVLAVILDENQFDLVALGLAALAGALLVGELGLDRAFDRRGPLRG